MIDTDYDLLTLPLEELCSLVRDHAPRDFWSAAEPEQNNGQDRQLGITAIMTSAFDSDIPRILLAREIDPQSDHQLRLVVLTTPPQGQLCRLVIQNDKQSPSEMVGLIQRSHPLNESWHLCQVDLIACSTENQQSSESIIQSTS